jgi:hypothetical protein
MLSACCPLQGAALFVPGCLLPQPPKHTYMLRLPAALLPLLLADPGGARARVWVHGHGVLWGAVGQPGGGQDD